jgi:hypothetical protein
MAKEIELGENVIFRGSINKGKRNGFGELIRDHEFSLSGIWLNNRIVMSEKLYSQQSNQKLK